MNQSLESHVKPEDDCELSEGQISGLLRYFGLDSHESIQELVQGIKVLAFLQRE